MNRLKTWDEALQYLVDLDLYVHAVCVSRLPDIAQPFVAFKNGGYDVTLSSIAGGAIPLDPAGLAAAKGVEAAERFLNCGTSDRKQEGIGKLRFVL